MNKAFGQILLSLLLLSCSKEEPTLTKEQMLDFTPKEGADKVEIVLARDINDAIPCSDYGEGCLSAHKLKTRGLGFIAVEFQTVAQAESAARKIYGWTVQNWLLDDVDGEPELERWAEKYFKVKSFNPSKQIKEGLKETPAENVEASKATNP